MVQKSFNMESQGSKVTLTDCKIYDNIFNWWETVFCPKMYSQSDFVPNIVVMNCSSIAVICPSWFTHFHISLQLVCTRNMVKGGWFKKTAWALKWWMIFHTSACRLLDIIYVLDLAVMYEVLCLFWTLNLWIFPKEGNHHLFRNLIVIDNESPKFYCLIFRYWYILVNLILIQEIPPLDITEILANLARQSEPFLDQLGVRKGTHKKY